MNLCYLSAMAYLAADTSKIIDGTLVFSPSGTANMGDDLRQIDGCDVTDDYWKLMANGDMVEDGDGWLRDQTVN